ncbi:TPA: Spy/CpxP family protein refolding chaperone [Candidatus Galligastranaerophilus intestinavium]|uniref:Spy/CpxP family protein refolding chaperone n=1 Tax=Candidatus Galligastranaerophilus intestinavium TaxID=2840836 RepID=A0A9D1FGZ9_9BACT|nr:Spy/CpxP family protein refolding chaperone [Candidatus Galligastranaerophilus intestinavium]
MKKIVLASTLALFLCTAAVQAAPCAADCDCQGKAQAPCSKDCKCQKPAMTDEQKAEMKAKMDEKRAEFDKKLGLTDEQKAKSEQIRKDGFEKMKPVMDQIKVKRDEIKTIRENGSLTQAEANAKVQALHKEIMELKGQAKEIRKQNMQDFEAILTDKQKKTLEKMKQEGRKEFAKKHKAKKIGGFDGRPMPPHHPAMQPLGTPAPQTK